MNAINKRIDDIHWAAERGFKDHVITHELDHGPWQAWTCAKPDCCHYRFQVIKGPGWIQVRGDVGGMQWERAYEMLDWVRESIDSIDYFCSKVPACFKTREFCSDVANDWIARELADLEAEIVDADEATKQDLAERRDALADIHYDLHELSEEGLCDRLYKDGIIQDSDFPSFRTYTADFLWSREALKWFLARLPETVATAGATA